MIPFNAILARKYSSQRHFALTYITDDISGPYNLCAGDVSMYHTANKLQHKRRSIFNPQGDKMHDLGGCYIITLFLQLL